MGGCSTPRERIVVAAIHLFADRGFEASTMRDLATAVNVKAPALYNHFSSKEAILTEVLRSSLAVFFRAVLEPAADDPPLEQLRGIVRRHVLYQIENFDLAWAYEAISNRRTIERLLPESELRKMSDAQHAYVRLIEGLIREAAPESKIDPAVATFSIVSICERVITWYRPDGRLSPEQVADQIWTMVAAMLDVN